MIEVASNWLGLASIVIALGSVVWAWLTSGSTDNAKSITELKDEVKGIESRLHTVEGELKHLPDRDAAHRLELTMATLSGRLDTLDERLKPIGAISERLQEFLLEKVGK